MKILNKFTYLLSKFLKKSLNIPAIKNCIIDKTSRVCSGSHIVNSTMKKYSYIGNNCTILNTDIGSFCSIADFCIIGGASHPIEWVSTSPVFHYGKNIMNKNFSKHPFETVQKTTICNDVWIGTNCLIKSGITIGNGVVIGMGSVVVKDVEPYTIVAGNPAKIIRYRFDLKKREDLLKSRWWDTKPDELIQAAKHVDDVDLFIEGLKK